MLWVCFERQAVEYYALVDGRSLDPAESVKLCMYVRRSGAGGPQTRVDKKSVWMQKLERLLSRLRLRAKAGMVVWYKKGVASKDGE
jgi:hypothetical protein